MDYFDHPSADEQVRVGERHLRKFSRAAAVATGAAGLLALLGRAFELTALESLFTGWATMKANTALAFFLSGVLLWLQQTTAPRESRRGIAERWLARVCVVTLALIALLTLSEYLFGWELGIDELLIDDPASSGSTSPPGRMAVMTALNFALLALAFLAIDVETRGGRRPAEWLALMIAANAYMAILGYIYGVSSLYRVLAYTSMSLDAAVLFGLISIAFLCARPGAGQMRLVTAADPGGMLVRRLLPAAFMAPPIVGWLRLIAQQAGHYSLEFGLAHHVAANVVIFVTLVWFAARSVQRIDTERRKVSRSHTWQRAILNSADLSIISTDTKGIILTCNAGALFKLGYAAEELIGKVTPTVIHDPQEIQERARTLSRELGRQIEPGFEVFVAKARFDVPDENEWTYIRKDGGRFIVRLSVTALRDTAGNLTGFLGIGKDITAQRAAEQALRESEARYRELFEGADELIQGVAPDGRLLFVNRAWLKTLQYTPEEVAQLSFQQIVHPDFRSRYMETFQRVMAGEKLERIETVFIAKDGTSVLVEGTCDCQLEHGRPVAARSIFRDITLRKRYEQKILEQQKQLEAANAELQLLSVTDGLTGLYNRRAFDNDLNREFSRALRKRAPLSLVLLDLDRFKEYNDSFGHPAGDAVLQRVAQALRAEARETDWVTRFGGEEFAIILPDTDREGAIILAERFRLAIAAESWPHRPVTASLGVSTVNPAVDTEDAADLIAEADEALYRSKNNGRNRVTHAKNQQGTDGLKGASKNDGF